MKCPKCGCQNDDKNVFCKECGEPLKDKKIVAIPNIGRFKLSKGKTILLGVVVIVLIAIIAIGINSLDLGAPAAGNEALINIDNDQSNNSEDDSVYYSVSFTLTNAPREVDTYSAKVTWYGDNGEALMSETEDLKYNTVEDDHTVDMYIGKSHSPIDINEFVIEIMNNQGELVTSAHHKWIDN